MAGATDGKMSGAERAAIFLMSLGEKEAAEILKHMGPKEVQRVGMAMASIDHISRDAVHAVLNDFAQAVGEQTSFGMGAEDYVRNVLVDALGEDKAGGLIDRILLKRNTKGLDTLKWMDARAVADVIRLEHPQIMAIVLSYLDSDHAAAVLGYFPERVRADVLMRIATLDGIQPAALAELDDIMERQFSGAGSNVKSSSVGGVKAAANILNFVEGGSEAKLLDSIRQVDDDLGQQIQDLMFVFDNLAELDDQSIQLLLREISTESLVFALKGADDAVKEKIFKNMSKRAAEMLAEDLDARGPVKLSQVEAAQKEILSVARRMADAGEIMLGGGGEQML